jgi:hypothetical protein
LPFEHGVTEAAIEVNKFISSGVMVEDPMLTAQAAIGGQIGEVPFYTQLATGEPEYVNDVAANLSTPDKISSAKFLYRLANMHKSWSTMDLTRELALKDPLGEITKKIGGWWGTHLQKRLIQSALGIYADNAANDSSDMVKTVGTDAVGQPTAAEKISADVVLDAAQTMGDHKDALTAIAMHSAVYTTLQKLNLITFIPNARGEINIPTYLGYTVVVDDGMPAVMGTNRIMYTSILFAAGAFAHGVGSPMLPSELERIASAGYGGGQDIIHTRRSDIIHPIGFSFTSSSVAGKSATLAELATTANWDRKIQRKNAGIAFIRTNA